MAMRLVTRSDFDGLACGALLKEAGIIDNWKFAHPKDLQDGSAYGRGFAKSGGVTRAITQAIKELLRLDETQTPLLNNPVGYAR